MIDRVEARGVQPVPLAGGEAAARGSDNSSPTVEGPPTAEAAFEAAAVCALAPQQPPRSSDSGVKAEYRGPSTRPAIAGREMGTESGDQGEDEQGRLEDSGEEGSDGGVQDIGLGMAYALLAISKSAPAPDHEASDEEEPPSPTVRRKRTASQKVLRMSLLTESDDVRKKGKGTAGGGAAKVGRKPGSKGRSSKAPKAANRRAAKAAARAATARQQREAALDVKPKTKRSVRATAATTAAQRLKSEGASGGDSQQTSPRAAAAKANSQRRIDRAAQRSEEASEQPAAAGSLNIYCTCNTLGPPVV